MPRSSRHKSSKHSSRDAKDCSDSDIEYVIKDNRKDSNKESSLRVSKDYTSGEKRKLDLKEHKESFASGNGDYSEEYAFSKRHKDKVDDSANDRWNGRGQDERQEKKSKVSTESKSSNKRKDESLGVHDKGEESAKKSTGKSEVKHRESTRKEAEKERQKEKDKDKDKEKERRGKEKKSERLVDGQDHHTVTKKVAEKSEAAAQDQLQNPETKNQLDRLIKRKRDGSGDGDKHPDAAGDDVTVKRLSKDDVTNVEKHKDERHRDKYHEDMYRDNRHQDEKQRDQHTPRDHFHSRSNEKYSKDGKDSIEVTLKKSRPQDTPHDREYDHDLELNNYHERESNRDHERDQLRGRVREQDLKRDRIADHERDRDWMGDHNHNHGRDRDRDYDRDRDRDYDRDGDQERGRDRYRHDDQNGSRFDDRNVGYKNSRGRKRSPDDPDGYENNKSRGVRAASRGIENKSLDSGRIEPDTDRGRSQSRLAYQETVGGGGRKRGSPSYTIHGVSDEGRNFKSEDSKYRDGGTDKPRTNSSRDVAGFSGPSERASQYRPSERQAKADEGNIGDISVERSSSSKASPVGLVEKSLSSTSVERKYMSRSGNRRGHEHERDDSGRKNSSSIGGRDTSATDGRLARDFTLVDEAPQADSSFHRTSQGISSSFVSPPTSFRGSLEEDTRGNGTRYRRNGDPNMGRVQANAWRGPPNWSSSMPNGFIPFQHGPHGGFHTMIPQFPPPMFGVRPSIDINPVGTPYRLPDADRFNGNLRPLGWQNMMDSSVPSHLHSWDGSNGVFRDEQHMYGAPNWDQNRHLMHGRGWESNADMWKVHNGDVSMNMPSMSQEEDHPMHSRRNGGNTEQESHKSESNNSYETAKSTETAVVPTSPAVRMSKFSPKVSEKLPGPTKAPSDDGSASWCRAYFLKLDISSDLAYPELYGQFMSLLDGQPKGPADKESNMLVNLKDGGRVIPKSSRSLFSRKLFPAADDSVSQRAMDFYKKQRMRLSASAGKGPVEIDTVSNQEKMEEDLANCNVEKEEAPISLSDTAMDDDYNQEEVDAVVIDVPHNKLENPSFDKAHDTMLEVSNEKSQLEPLHIRNLERVDEVTNELEMQGDVFANVKSIAANMATDGKQEEKRRVQDNGDDVSDPLFVSDGSPNSSLALLPGSNESVIISRIHHSPESTH